MFYLPGVLKRLDAVFYARAFRRGLAAAGIPVQGRTLSCPAEGANEGPAAIDAHFEWPDGVGAYRVARGLGLPFVCTLRGKLVSQIAHRSKRRQIREMLLGADALIAVSRSLAELARQVADRDLDIRVIPNGIDGRIFRRGASPGAGSPSAEARAACGWVDDAKYVVSVGHLQALKGFHHLVDAWPEVRRRLGDVRLVLVGGSVGEPGYERRLREQIDASVFGGGGDRPGAVTLAGRVQPERVAMMLNAADLFVLASRSEGCCNAITEALACGCPVVATDVGGNREIVSDPIFGRLVPAGEAEALIDGVCTALTTEWDRDRIAVSCGRRDWQQVARECVDVFEEVVGRARGVGGLRMKNRESRMARRRPSAGT
jgi:glycosyltransferase involved in cell wall biosynthesis